MLGAVYLDIADDGERAGHEQAAQIAVILFADPAEPVLAAITYRIFRTFRIYGFF